MRMDYLEYKGYKGSVEYSKADNCLFGSVQGLSKDGIIYEGNTLEELEQDFRNGIDDYIATCKANGVEPRKPYSGKLMLRLTPVLHSKVASYAEQSGTTINAFINKVLEKAVRTHQPI